MIAQLWNDGVDIQKALILRMPNEETAMKLKNMIKNGDSNLPLSIKLDPNQEDVVIGFDGNEYKGKMKPMPCVTEVYTTDDRKSMTKLANVAKIVDCTPGAESSMADAREFGGFSGCS